MKKLFLILFFLFISNTLSAGIWPIYFKDNNKTNFIVPFFQKNQQKFTFRPFFSYSNNNEDYNFYFLYPLVRLSKHRKLIFPFYSSRTSQKNHTNFFPFFWGKTDDNRTYGGFFPVYGKLLNRLKYDEIKFFLWPLWSEKKRGEDIDYSMLWPFFGLSKGKNYSGLKFWPFFGYKTKDDYFYEKFFLWPFFIFQKRRIGVDKNEFEKKHTYFPFYIHTFSQDYDYKTFLWPFFHYNKRGNYYKYYAFPWPFFTYERDKKEYKLSIFPFYRKVWLKNYQKQTFLWIVFSNEKTFLKGEKYSTKKSFLLINRFEKNYKQNYVYRNFWPFFEYVKQNNDYVFKLFEPFPFKIGPVYNLYSAFFNIFYVANVKNKKRVSFLWGLFVYEKNKNSSMIKLFQFIKFRWRHENKVKVSQISIDNYFAGL